MSKRTLYLLLSLTALALVVLSTVYQWWSFRGAFALSSALYLFGALGRMPTKPDYRMDEFNLHIATAWLYVGSAAVCALLALCWR